MTVPLAISVVVPCYNELRTLEPLLKRVASSLQGFNFEIVIVDDGSDDGSGPWLDKYVERPFHRLVRHSTNFGKGAALQSALRLTSGDVVVIQDADLEYAPEHLPELLGHIVRGEAEVVYGSRLVRPELCQDMRWWQWSANRFLTRLSRLTVHWPLTDVGTGHKIFLRSKLQSPLQERGFAVDAELTLSLERAVPPDRFLEVPINYTARGYKDGKKIRVRDGLRAAWVLLRAAC